MTRDTVFRSRWVLPIEGAPIDGGWVASRAGVITDLGRGRPPAAPTDLGDVALLPGLVNAHTHLELSALAGRVPPSATMPAWIRGLLAARAEAPASADHVVAAMRQAVQAMRDAGVVLVGDVSNSLASVAVLHEAGMDAVVFHELIGFNVVDAVSTVRDAWQRVEQESRRHPAVPTGVVAHAPYSVAPGLFVEIGRHARDTPLSVHVGESPEELAFLRTGEGPFRDLLEELGVWTPSWEPPACDPVEYLKRVGYLAPGMLAVHAVHVPDQGLERLREAGAVVVTCPRSNEWVGGGLPRVSHFYGAGVPVAIGTDSLASAATLSVFDELAELRRVAPDVSAASLLDSATRVGANALGFGRQYGSLMPGKRAAFVAVDVPADTTDVEEYLVGGVPAGCVRPVAG